MILMQAHTTDNNSSINKRWGRDQFCAPRKDKRPKYKAQFSSKFSPQVAQALPARYFKQDKDKRSLQVKKLPLDLLEKIDHRTAVSLMLMEWMLPHSLSLKAKLSQ